MIIIDEATFSQNLKNKLSELTLDHINFIVGPGRSGAIAAVYASYLLRKPFVPYKIFPSQSCGRNVLIVDTAENTGRTIRKASSIYDKKGYITTDITVFHEPPRVHFWYENIDLEKD